MKLYACLVLAALSVAVIAQTNLKECSYKAPNGKVYDLSPLISKSDKGYMWTQTVWITENNFFTNDDYSDTQNFTFQLQVCKNITTPMHPNCNVTSPIYMFNPTDKSCNALGNLNIAEFQMNPFKDGVYLDIFGGSAVNRIVRYEARIYFVCEPTTPMTGPLLEHIKESYQVHIRINTKYVC